MTLPTIVVILQNKPDKSGMMPIMIRVTYKRKLYHRYTGIKVLPNDFELGNIKKHIDNAAYKNRLIRNDVSQIEKECLVAQEENRLTESLVKSIVSRKSDERETVTEIFNKVIELYRDKLSKGYIRNWEVTRNKLESYKTKINISEITPVFMRGFEKFLKEELGNSRNTISSTTKKVCSMLTKAYQNGLISKDPLLEYHAVTYKQTQRGYLLKEDITKIEKFIDETTNEYLKNVAIWFVFACYSGLRYQDIARWEEKDFVKGNTIYYTDLKTKTPHFIPVGKKLKGYIAKVRLLPPIIGNMPANRALKEIQKITGIYTLLTMHVARHTFGTMFLANGGRIEDLQKFMGHSDIKTTQIYVQMSHETLLKEGLRVFDKY